LIDLLDEHFIVEHRRIKYVPLTTKWFFAPPSAWTRLPYAVAVASTYSAIGVDPTKLAIAVGGVADELVARLAGRVRALKVGAGGATMRSTAPTACASTRA
jgi:hypothetical protein